MAVNTTTLVDDPISNPITTTGIEAFVRFRDDEIVPGSKQTLTNGLWAEGTGTLTTFFTSSVQSASATSKYYWNVYDAIPTETSSAAIQFAVTYGHVYGSGSPSISSDNTSNVPTQAIYSQYKSLLLTAQTTKFTWPNETTGTNHFFAISIARNKIKQKMDPGNWQLNLISGSVTVRLIDDSGDQVNSTSSYMDMGRVYSIVSGNINIGSSTATVYNSTSPVYYGLFYPDCGILLLNPDKINDVLTGSVDLNSTLYKFNHTRLFNWIKSGSYFVGRNIEEISSIHYTVTVPTTKFNFSNNPTFFDPVSGTLVNSTFYNDPKVYITTVGLYNDSRELLAVAKLSKPLQKSFSSAAMIKVKLDF